MVRHEYQSRLKELREDVIGMGDLVLERFKMAMNALKTRDIELGREVTERDHEVNELYLELERKCTDLIALQQPVAGDLRFIVASFKIITDLERIADLETNLAAYANRPEGVLDPDLDAAYIGERIHEAVANAMIAYEMENVEACFVVAERDDEIDDLCARASERIIYNLIDIDLNDFSGDLLFAEVSCILLTIRDLERIGDHAVNIAARTLYMIESNDELIY